MNYHSLGLKLAPWKESNNKPRQHIKKQRHYFVAKVRLVKAMVFPVYACESWTIKLSAEELMFLNCDVKGPSSQSYGFSSSHVWM